MILEWITWIVIVLWGVFLVAWLAKINEELVKLNDTANKQQQALETMIGLLRAGRHL